MNDDLILELKKLAQRLIDADRFEDTAALKADLMKIYDALTVIEHREVATGPADLQAQEITEHDDATARKDEEDIDLPVGEAELKELFEPKFDSVVEDMRQKKEFEDTVPIEDTQKLFEAKSEQSKPVSLHEKLLRNKIQVGLNDRIAFVNKLFNFNQAEFNAVLRELNGFTSKEQALTYIQTRVKPKYNWEGKEELEERFMALIERKFI